MIIVDNDVLIWFLIDREDIVEAFKASVVKVSGFIYITASKMKLGLLNRSISQADLVDLIDEIKKLIAQSIRCTRTLTFTLSPHFLHVLGFKGTLQILAEQFQNEHKISIYFTDDGRPKPPANEMQILLHRAVRELLIKAIKYAQADKIQLSLQRVDSSIKITVQDEGIGFDTSIIDHPADMKSFGLFGICERLNYFGGQVEIESKPEHGSRISLWAALKRERVEENYQR